MQILKCQISILCCFVFLCKMNHIASQLYKICVITLLLVKDP